MTRLLALAALVACNDSIFDLTDPEVRLETPLVWAGTQIVLTSPAFVGSDTLPLVLLDTDTATTAYTAPDTLRVAAPDSQGTYTIWVALRGRTPIPVGEVTLEGGYSGWWNAPLIGGFPLQWPGGGLPTFLIALPTGLARVDPRFKLVATQFSDPAVFSHLCANGPGPAPGGRIAVQGRTLTGCGPVVALRPDAPWVAPDTGPPLSGGYRFAAQLGPARWLAASHHGVTIYSRDAAGAWVRTDYRPDETYGIAVSPRGDRAVPLGYSLGGNPVFTPASAEPVYVLHQFVTLRGAQFTDDGDTLYVVGEPPPDSSASGTSVLAALRASDGAVLRSAPAWHAAANLVLDPGTRWLYLVGYTTGLRHAVHVVDRATLQPVTTLVVPSGAVPSDVGHTYPMLSASERKLYLVLTTPWWGPNSYTRIVAFDLMR